jgi:hypothetical protein
MLIEVDQSTATLIELLKERAAAEGTSLDALLRPLVEAGNGMHSDEQLQNEAMLAALERSSERLKDMPVRGSTEETLQLIREGRAGGMWDYEPTE